MATSKPSELEKIQDRVFYLEEMNDWYSFAMDILRQMGDIYGDTSKSRNTDDILDNAKQHIDLFFGFHQMAFYLIDEEDSDFLFAKACPKSAMEEMKHDIDGLIEEGKFSWALNQNKAVICEISNDYSIVLHVIASKTRLRGMFIGYLSAGKVQDLTGGPISLLTVVLHNTGYALESSALYEIVQRKNDELEKKVDARTRELKYQFHHDALTGLPNRTLFFERVQQSIDKMVEEQTNCLMEK